MLDAAATTLSPLSGLVPARTGPDYNEAVVRKFTIVAIVWAIVAFAAGCYIAAELCWPQLNLGLSETNFGRLRPVHTSAAIFAFGGCA
jgi:cytochrome c oxidase cbb3-type subunit 1